MKLNNGNLDNENELLMRVSAGDEFAFREIYNHYHGKVYALGMYLTHSDFLAEEIVQDAFMRIWLNRDTLQEVVNFKAYFKTIARNVAFDYLRATAAEKLAHQEMMFKSEGIELSVEHTSVSKEYERIYQEAIATLSPKRKRAYLLSRQAGLKNAEISAEMEISLYTVKEHLKLASRQIRAYMDKRISIIAYVIASIFFD